MKTATQITAKPNTEFTQQNASEGSGAAVRGPASGDSDQFQVHRGGARFDSLISSSSGDTANEIKQRFAGQMKELAGDREAFHKMMQKVFGSGYDQAAAEGFRQKALAGDTSWMPEIEFQSNSTLQGGYGAYDAERNVIYLNESLKGNVDFAAQVYAEEVGHFLDGQLNSSDTVGDEGEMFRRLLGGESLSEAQISEIRAEDDTRVINVNGKQVEVEFFFKKIKKAFKKVVKGVKKIGKKIVNGVKNVGKKIVNGVKNTFKKLVESGILNIAFTIMTFIPGLNVIGLVGNAALGVYNGVKNGDWMGAALGVAGAFTGGAASVFGKAAGTVAQYAAKAQKVLKVVQGGLKAYQAAKNGNWAGALAGAAGAAAGIGANWSGKVADTLNQAATWANRVETGVAAYRAAQRGDYLGAIGVGAGLASDFTTDGTQIDDLLQGVSNGAFKARGVQQAIRSGDYLGAASQLTAFAGQVTSGEASEQLKKASEALTLVDGAHDAIRSKNYAAAASALTQAGTLYGLSGETRDQILAAAGKMGQAASAFEAARNGDFATAARQLGSLTEGVLDRKTRNHFETAARVFSRASEVHQLVKDGKYWTAAYRVSQAGAQFSPDDATRARFDQASKLIQLAAGANAYIRTGRPEGAVRILDQALQTIGVRSPQLSGTLRTSADVLQTVNEVRQAVRRGDYRQAIDAARNGAERIGLDDVSEALDKVADTIDAARKLGKLGGIFERIFGSEARNQIDRVIESLTRTSVAAIRSDLGGAVDNLVQLDNLRQAA